MAVPHRTITMSTDHARDEPPMAEPLHWHPRGEACACSEPRKGVPTRLEHDRVAADPAPPHWHQMIATLATAGDPPPHAPKAKHDPAWQRHRPGDAA